MIRLHSAGPEHAALLRELHATCMAQDWSAASIGRLLALPGTIALIASDDMGGTEKPLGYLIALAAGEDADLAAIGVLPAARRRGIAGRLLDALRETARAAGLAGIVLEVDAANSAAIGLYKSRRFEPKGRRPGYYRKEDGPADALIFRAEVQ